MKTKLSLICIFLLISVLSSLSVIGASCTSVPVEDCTVDASLQLQGDSVFTLNDSNGDGAIKFGAPNVALDCNGSSLVGNNSGGSKFINFSDKTGINITNCIFQDYSSEIEVNDNTILDNITMISNTTFRILNNVKIINSNLTFKTTVTGDSGIILGRGTPFARADLIINNSFLQPNGTIGFKFEKLIDTSNVTIDSTTIDRLGNRSVVPENIVKGGNFIVVNSIIKNSRGFSYSGKDLSNLILKFENNICLNNYYCLSVIRFNDLSVLGTFKNNKINLTYKLPSNSRSYGLYTEGVSNIEISNNLIYGFEGVETYPIDIDPANTAGSNATNISILNNTMYSLGGAGRFIIVVGGNNSVIVNNNYMEGVLNQSAYVIGGSIGNNFTNNIVNITSRISNPIRGYAFEFYDNGYNNYILNNTIYGAIYGIRPFLDFGNNYNLIKDNEFINVTTHIYISNTNNISFEDNIYNEGIARYLAQNDKVNFTINETSTNYHLINLSNNGYTKLIWDGRKDLRVKNNTITINKIGQTNYSLLNVSTGIYTYHGEGFTLNVASNEEYEVDSCTIPTEDITLTANTRFCKGTYYLNDSNNAVTAGSIIIGDDDVVLDCNGATLSGNGTGNSRGIQIANRDNVTIKNCNTSGYARNINIEITDNSKVLNSTFYNYSLASILVKGDNNLIENNTFYYANNPILYFSSVTNSIVRNNIANITTGTITDNDYFIEFYGKAVDNNITIEDNIINGIGGISTLDSSNILVRNNKITTVTSGTGQLAFFTKNSFNNSFINNTMLNSRMGVKVQNASNILIANNTFFNLTTDIYPIWFTALTNNSIISGNNITLADNGILIHNSSNINITNNYIQDMLTNTDSYATGIRTQKKVFNIIIKDNRIVNYGSVGVFFRESWNIEIYNNTFNQISIADRITNVDSTSAYRDFYEPTTAIGGFELYKSWEGDSTEDQSHNRTNFIGNLYSYNITIKDNTFDSNVQTYLRLQGTENITHDLTNYWYRSFQTPVYLVDKDEFYNNNNFDRLSLVPKKNGEEEFIFIQAYMGTVPGAPTLKINYTISKTVMSFKNVNQSVGYELKLYNLTDQPDSQFVQIFNQTSTTPTAENVNTFTETIPPNNRSFVFSYITASQPKFTRIGTGITDVTYDYNTATNTLTIDCTGTGTITINTLDELKGAGGYFNHFSNGVLDDRYNTATFTFGCSNHEFKPYVEDNPDDAGTSGGTGNSPYSYHEDDIPDNVTGNESKFVNQTVTDKEPKINLPAIGDAIKEAIVNPKGFKEKWDSLKTLDKTILIIFTSAIILTLVFLISIGINKSIKKQSEETTPEEDFLD